MPSNRVLSLLLFFTTALLYTATLYWLNPATPACGPWGLPLGKGGVIVGACRAIFLIVVITSILIGLISAQIPSLIANKKKVRTLIHCILISVFGVVGYVGAQSFATYIGKVQQIPSPTLSEGVSQGDEKELGVESFRFTDGEAIERTNRTFTKGETVYFRFTIVGLTPRDRSDDIEELDVVVGLVAKVGEATRINESALVSATATQSIASPNQYEVDNGLVGQAFPQTGQYQLTWIITDNVSGKRVKYENSLILR